jgi:hypothetical protein
MRSLQVVVRGVLGQYPAEVPLAEDQHAVGEFGADGQHEAFGEAVRPWTSWRDLDHLDTRVREHPRRTRPRTVPRDRVPGTGTGRRGRRDPSPGCGPAASSRVRRDERAPPGRVGNHRRPRSRRGRRAAGSPRSRRRRNRRPACWRLGCAELPPAGVGAPDRRGWDPVALQDPADRRGADAVAEFE